jgi:sugar O-acyltransferase (sialic acid O-acetyltransferase NeuD family)
VRAFVHPEDDQPEIDFVAVRNRPSQRFDYPADGTYKGRPLLCGRDWPELLRRRGIGMVIVTLSDKFRRLEEIARAREAGLEIPSAVHPSVVVLPDAILGSSLVVHARAVIGYRAELGDGVIVGIGVQLDHHNVIREGVTLDPAAVTAGNVLIERCAHVHTGASIINRVTIGAEAVVAAGAVVIRDVAPRTLVAGVPATEKKRW